MCRVVEAHISKVKALDNLDMPPEPSLRHAPTFAVLTVLLAEFAFLFRGD